MLAFGLMLLAAVATSSVSSSTTGASGPTRGVPFLVPEGPNVRWGGPSDSSRIAPATDPRARPPAVQPGLHPYMASQILIGAVAATVGAAAGTLPYLSEKSDRSAARRLYPARASRFRAPRLTP